MIITDANVIMHLVMKGEFGASASDVLARDNEWQAPPIWVSEVQNAVLKYVRHRDMPVASATALVRRARRVVRTCRRPAVQTVLRLAYRSGCSAYDCEYVAVAMRHGVRLVTTDRKLLAAFPDVAVSPEGFVA